MATENIIMAMVKAGANRQVSNEVHGVFSSKKTQTNRQTDRHRQTDIQIDR